MRKGIKILFSILSSLILAAIILPLLAGLLLHLPFVQNYVVGKATEIVSEKLGTTVSIDRIHLKPFSRLTVDGFYVEDFDKDTLLYARVIEVPVVSLGLLKGGTILGNVKLTDVDFNLVQGADSTSNLKKILLKLKSDKPKENKKPFALSASGVSIENMKFHYNKYRIRPRAYGVNFDDIDVTGFWLDTKDVSIVDDSVTLRINRISLKDKSGFELDTLSCDRFVISGEGMHFTELKIITPESDVKMQRLSMITGTWEGYKDFTNDVRLEAELSGSKVSFATIAYFAQGLKGWTTTLYDVNGFVEGPVVNMSGKLNDVKAGVNTDLSMAFAIRGLPDITRTTFDFNIGNLYTDAADIKKITEDITRKSLSENLMDKVANLGRIGLTGNFKGKFTDFRAAAQLKSGNGTIDFNLDFIPAEKQTTAFAGNVSVYELRLGDFLGNKSLGNINLKATVDGSFGKEGLNGNADALLASVFYNGYNYKDINIKGYFSNKLFKGNIDSKDPNIAFNFDGMFDFNDSTPRYDFDLKISNADLAKLNFNKRDSVSVLKTRVLASASGSTLDELNGRITVSDLLYIGKNDSIPVGNVVISGENNEKWKSINVRSKFADIDYRSRTSYAQVIKDIEKVFHYYLPSLSSGHKKGSGKAISAISDVNNYSILNVNIKEANNVAGIFVPGLIISKGTRLSFMFNPDSEQLSLGASSDYIEYKNNFISKLDINSRNQGDSITLFVRAEDMYASGMYLPNLSVIGALRENQANATLRTQDPKREFSALIGLNATLGQDPVSRIPQMRLRFTPSNIKSKDKTWNIYTRSIVIDSTKIDFNNFIISGQDQQLRINGVAGSEKTDTLHITLSRFALNPISQLTNRMGYEVEGMTSGRADLISVMKDGLMSARLNFDSVKVNNIAIPNGSFSSTWDFERDRARFVLASREPLDTVILGYYSPSDGRYLADINMKNINLALLDPLFKGVISNTLGLANAEARMTGVRKAMKFNGTISVPSLSTQVDFLNVPYTVADAQINIKDNVLMLDPTPLKDPMGNIGKFDMNVNLNSLSNVVYKFGIRPENLMILNTTSRNNKMFYGRVFASGIATIKGDKRGVNMDITATTKPKSEFYMPLSDESTMGVSDIITFKSSKDLAIDSTNYLVRKQMILERRNKPMSQAEKSNMNIRMALNVTPDLDFQLLIDPRVGDILKGKGTGSLTLNINPTANEFSMYGDYEIQEGSYQFTLQDVISKRFTLEQGSKIVWTGEPADALLNVTGVYKLKTSLAPLLGTDGRYSRNVPVECRIILSDRLSQPKITFNVTVPGADPIDQAAIATELGTQESMSMQFFFLLAANSFYPTTGVGNIGTAAGTSVAFDFLTNQLSNILSNQHFDIGFRYRQGDTDADTSDEFNIDISTQLLGNRLLLEVEGNYDAGNNANKTGTGRASNVTGDFYITWLIDKSGNLRAKGFTRTVDRYEEKGLQESGVGIYYKEDFNSLKDIVRNFKDRFSNWGRKRKARKEAKKIEKLEKQNAARKSEEKNINLTLPPTDNLKENENNEVTTPSNGKAAKTDENKN